MTLFLYGCLFFIFLTIYYYTMQLALPKWYFKRRLRQIKRQSEKTNKRNVKKKKKQNKITLNKYYLTIENILIDAKVPVTVNEFILLLLLADIVIAVIFSFLINIAISILISMLFLITPFFLLSQFKKRRTEKMLQQLPDALEVISTSLKSGFSLVQTFEVVANENIDPLSNEFKYLMKELTFGKSLEDALGDFSVRNDLHEIRTFVDTVLIARETGGTMTNVFDELTDIMRESERLRRETKALTAQGRISAFIIGSLPFVLFLFLYFVNPSYIGVLFTHKLGIVLIIISLILQTIGILVMKKLIQLKVR